MLMHRQPVAQAPQRVVILGATGFVGLSLVRHLESAGIPYVAPGSRDVDLCLPTSMGHLTGLLHATDALVFVSALTPDRGRDVRTLMSNLAMAEHVSAALTHTPCAHLVYISSDAVYADDLSPVRETAPVDPESFHGLMHLARERILAAAAHQMHVPYLILRPSLLYGPGDPHNSYGPNRFLRTVQANGTIDLFGEGEDMRDHVYIHDVARLIGLGLVHRSQGLVNVATGTSSSFGGVARLVAEVWGGSVAINGRARATPITHRHFDTTALMEVYPTFRWTPLRQGLEQTVQAIRQTLARSAA